MDPAASKVTLSNAGVIVSGRRKVQQAGPEATRKKCERVGSIIFAAAALVAIAVGVGSLLFKG
jgi:hypothetical protein